MNKNQVGRYKRAQYEEFEHSHVRTHITGRVAFRCRNQGMRLEICSPFIYTNATYVNGQQCKIRVQNASNNEPSLNRRQQAMWKRNSLQLPRRNEIKIPVRLFSEDEQ